MTKLSWIVALSAAALSVAPSSARAQCGDPWVTQAVREVFSRAPQGNDCKIDRYGGGRWSGYAQLKKYVSLSTVCNDPWIAQAYNDLYGRLPNGSGSTGECNVYLYGGASWNSFPDLKNKVQTAVSALAAAQSRFDRSGNFFQGSTMVPVHQVRIQTASGIVAAGGGNIVAAGGGNVRAQGQGNIVAAGGGSIVAAGGGNIVAAGGGNFVGKAP